MIGRLKEPCAAAVRHSSYMVPRIRVAAATRREFVRVAAGFGDSFLDGPD
jgi:hypothetical protein